MKGSRRLRMSPTRCRLPVHRTWTWSADFRLSGRPCIDTPAQSVFRSLGSRPRDTQIRLSAIQLKVIVGMGPLSDGFWWSGSVMGDGLGAWWRGDTALVQFVVTGTETGTLSGKELRLLVSDVALEARRSNQRDRFSAQRRSWASSVTFMLIRSKHHHHHQCDTLSFVKTTV